MKDMPMEADGGVAVMIPEIYLRHLECLEKCRVSRNSPPVRSEKRPPAACRDLSAQESVVGFVHIELAHALPVAFGLDGSADFFAHIEHIRDGLDGHGRRA